jgi:hypothetical protein
LLPNPDLGFLLSQKWSEINVNKFKNGVAALFCFKRGQYIVTISTITYIRKETRVEEKKKKQSSVAFLIYFCSSTVIRDHFQRQKQHPAVSALP